MKKQTTSPFAMTMIEAAENAENAERRAQREQEERNRQEAILRFQTVFGEEPSSAETLPNGDTIVMCEGFTFRYIHEGYSVFDFQLYTGAACSICGLRIWSRMFHDKAGAGRAIRDEWGEINPGRTYHHPNCKNLSITGAVLDEGGAE